MNKEIKPLYRKVNTKARNCHHNSGTDAKYERNTKKGIQRSMKKNDHRGLDYTPLYKFLLSKIGEDWTSVHSEALSRLDKEEPIFYLVARNDSEKNDFVYCGTNSCYNGLYIDSNNKLQKVNPNLKNEDLYLRVGAVLIRLMEHHFKKLGKILIINKLEKKYEKSIRKR